MSLRVGDLVMIVSCKADQTSRDYRKFMTVPGADPHKLAGCYAIYVGRCEGAPAYPQVLVGCKTTAAHPSFYTLQILARGDRCV